MECQYRRNFYVNFPRSPIQYFLKANDVVYRTVFIYGIQLLMTNQSENREIYVSGTESKCQEENLMELEKRMMEICCFYDYDIICRNDEEIIITDVCNENVFKYNSAEELVKDWEDICRISNDDYILNGLEKPFKWL